MRISHAGDRRNKDSSLLPFLWIDTIQTCFYWNRKLLKLMFYDETNMSIFLNSYIFLKKQGNRFERTVMNQNILSMQTIRIKLTFDFLGTERR